ncbi:MAG: RHS repeat-associated core domain-containing protein, partial [Actinobacteria bacterium]|nr:RHS repeat-associated core domain-containing protein [Actinomycetota bacterium]
TTSAFVRDPQGGLVAERIGANEYYYVFDGLGSVVALVDANGVQRAAYTYDPYGGHATATAMNGALPPNPWRYAGGALDATGLYHFGARYYDPNLGRWTQQDSVVSLGDPANANRYAYAGDDPVNFVDPTGLYDVTDAISDAAAIAEGGYDAITGGEDAEYLLLGDIVGAAAGGFVATGCAAAAGYLSIPTAGLAGAAGIGVCATLSAGVGAAADQAVSDYLTQ